MPTSVNNARYVDHPMEISAAFFRSNVHVNFLICYHGFRHLIRCRTPNSARSNRPPRAVPEPEKPIAPGTYLDTRAHKSAVCAMAASNGVLVSAGVDCQISVLRAQPDGLLQQGSMPLGPEPPTCVRVWPDGGRAAIGGAEFNGVLLVDTQQAGVSDVIMGHLAQARDARVYQPFP